MSDQAGNGSMFGRRPTATANNLSFSLAGPPGAPPPYILVGGSYVDADYQEFNPQYNRPATQPVWGLSKPFPRVMRPGMRRGPTADNEATIAFEPNEVGSTQVAPQISKTAVRPDHASLQQDRRSQVTASRQDSIRGPGSTTGKTLAFPRPTACVGLPSALNRSVSAESRVLHSSRLTDWESQQIQHRLRYPVTTVPKHDLSQDLTSEKIQEQDTAQSVKSNVPKAASEQQPEDDAIVDDARRRLQEYADTADHDGALAPPPPNLEDLEYRRSVHVDQDEFFNRWAKIRHDFREPLAEFLGVRLHSQFRLKEVIPETLTRPHRHS
jgi:hypothetical protein